MSAELLDRSLEAAHVGETIDWEFKSARGGFPGSFWETYSAMANAEGGVVVLGVRKTDAGAVLDGLTTEQIARYQKTLWDGLNNRGQVDALAAAEIEALATADIEGVVSNSRLQELLTDHPVDITRMLQGLCERGFMISDNRRRWTTYRLGGGATSIHSLFDEAGEERNSLLKPGDLSHKPGDLSHKPRDLSHKPGGELTPEEEKTLSDLADPISRSGRAKPELVRRVILEVCAHRYLTADQIATLLHRNGAGLRTRYLYPMTGEGLLRLRYPESPNRPDQAYIVVAKE